MSLVATVLNRDLTAIDVNPDITGFQYVVAPATNVADVWRTTADRPYAFSPTMIAALEASSYDRRLGHGTPFDYSTIPYGSDWDDATLGHSRPDSADNLRRDNARLVRRMGQAQGGGLAAGPVYGSGPPGIVGWQKIVDSLDVAGAIDESALLATTTIEKIPNPSPPPDMVNVVRTHYPSARFGLGKVLQRATGQGHCIAIGNSSNEDRELGSVFPSPYPSRIITVLCRSIQITWTSLDDSTCESLWGAYEAITVTDDETFIAKAEALGAHYRQVLEAAKTELLTLVP